MAPLKLCHHLFNEVLHSELGEPRKPKILAIREPLSRSDEILLKARSTLFNDDFNIFMSLKLPRELRDLVYRHYFCPDGIRRTVANYPDASNEYGQLCGFNAGNFAMALLYVNRQVRRESEKILCKHSVFVFDSQVRGFIYKCRESSVHKNLQHLEPRCRKMIESVWRKGFEASFGARLSISKAKEYLNRLHMFTLVMVFLSQECSVTDVRLGGHFIAAALVKFAGEEKRHGHPTNLGHIRC